MFRDKIHSDKNKQQKQDFKCYRHKCYRLSHEKFIDYMIIIKNKSLRDICSKLTIETL